MKYIKKFNESVEDIDLNDIREVFYNISDKLYVAVGIPGFSTDKIGVIIRSNIRFNKIKFNDIKDDLEFAIDYLNSKFKLTLTNLYTYGIDKEYKSYEEFLNDNIDDIFETKELSMVTIKLYFK